MLSKQFRDAVRLHPAPQYRLAISCGIDPCWLSKALHSAVKIRIGEPRIIAIGKLIGLGPADCFVDEEETGNK